MRWSFNKSATITKVFKENGYLGLPEKQLKRWYMNDGAKKAHFLMKSVPHDKANDLFSLQKNDSTEYKNINHGITLDSSGLDIMKIKFDDDEDNEIVVQGIPGLYQT